ncbi:MAG: hypothetical protein COS42_08390 [Flavobacteriales bacterium CG03_land_8_20_14_0_80_35_15]|nr:MAG: hypothetical protein COS42_08390 [Flavobacteriales bacterium CG03_land_8_20_14_0_80_35_15]
MPEQFFQPWYRFVIPALGMEVEHGLFWEAVVFNSPDDVECAVVAKFQKLRVSDGIFFGGFVADVVEVAVPSPSCISYIVQFIKVDIKIGFCNNAELFVVILFPDFPVVKG